MKDWWLIKKFVEQDSQAAFADLARQYTDLVYGICLRELGEPALAEEAAQAVFLILAQKACLFRRGTTLSSWLFQTALLTSKNVRRQEARRRERERITMAKLDQATWKDLQGWSEVEPLLNEALQALPNAQRGLILERFLEDRSLAEIGAARGISEDAARMRINRALDRLRRFFVSRNVLLSTTALAALLPLAVRPAPAHCAESILRLGMPAPVPPALDTAIQAIARGAIHTMNIHRLKFQVGAIALVVVLSFGTAGAVRVTTQAKAHAALIEKQQDQAKALAVLDQMYATYAAMHSFRCNVTSREDPLGTAQNAVYELQRPNKLRFHRVTLLGADMSGQAVAVSDGSSLYVTCTENKGLADRYVRMTAARTAEHNDLMAGFGGLPAWGTEPYAGMPNVALGLKLRPASSLSAPKYSLGQPVVLDLSGQPGPISFDVVIAQMHYLMPVGDMKDDPEIVTYYIGQRDHLLYRVTAAYMVGPNTWDTRTETYNGIEVNPSLPASDFVFTPSPGSKEVRDTSDLFPSARM